MSYADNTLHFRKKAGGLGTELEMIIPSPGEIRLLGNRNKQCAYYQVGKSSPMHLMLTCN